ncbi:hypothetical protein HYFRA_00000562 [Hymenoscyphus fraxineus]|uniref:Rhodopsin domain-containing protein n=1 Tax=Hymenoscyphus fraxineus TaxID=746836 RepID=A0A9N9L321_9HELO|nr:hypothetical protein HYFRA_00000562 [Hymenoscyphus fraxineus]
MKTSKKAYVTGILMLAAVSLAAAVVRLIIETEILNGGYAAHTDVNLTLTNLLYWTMIESGLALISACLPTLHYFAARSTIRVGSIRSLLHLDSLRSPFSSRVTGTSGTSPYSEITVVKAFRVSSVRDNDEISEYSSKREARGDSEIAMVTLKPGEAHSKV